MLHVRLGLSLMRLFGVPRGIIFLEERADDDKTIWYKQRIRQACNWTDSQILSTIHCDIRHHYAWLLFLRSNTFSMAVIEDAFGRTAANWITFCHFEADSITIVPFCRSRYLSYLSSAYGTSISFVRCDPSVYHALMTDENM